MFEILVDIDSFDDVWHIIDKSVNHILIDRYEPRLNKLPFLDNSFDKKYAIRKIQIDFQTDLNGLQQLLISQPNWNELRIYQFEKEVSERFEITSIQMMSESQQIPILKEMGFRNCIWMDYDSKLGIRSIDHKFIESIQNDKKFTNKIIKIEK